MILSHNRISSMFAALRATARRIKQDALTVYFCARDPRTPLLVRLLALAIAAYALSPIGQIPDFIPVLGLLDDVILLPMGILAVVNLTPAEVIEASREQARALASRPVSWRAAVVIVVIWVLAILAGFGGLARAGAWRQPVDVGWRWTEGGQVRVAILDDIHGAYEGTAGVPPHSRGGRGSADLHGAVRRSRSASRIATPCSRTASARSSTARCWIRIPDLRIVAQTGNHAYHIDFAAATAEGRDHCPGGRRVFAGRRRAGDRPRDGRDAPDRGVRMLRSGAASGRRRSRPCCIGIRSASSAWATSAGTVARIAAALGMRVLAWSPRLTDEAAARTGAPAVRAGRPAARSGCRLDPPDAGPGNARPARRPADRAHEAERGISSTPRAARSSMRQPWSRRLRSNGSPVPEARRSSISSRCRRITR